MTEQGVSTSDGEPAMYRAVLPTAQTERTVNEPSAIVNLMPSLKLSPDSVRGVCRSCQAPVPFGWYCDACRQDDQRQHALVALSVRLNNLPGEQSEAGVPPAFRSVMWRLPAWAQPYLSRPRGLCLTGPAGSGKTATVCLLMRDTRKAELERAMTGHQETMTTWRFVSVPKLIMELQDTWRKGADERTALDRLNEVVRVDRLILDDLGAEKLTDYVRQALYYLLNEREQWQRVTYLTTNFSLARLDEQLDSRLSSRIAGMCDVKAMVGRDRRLEKSA